MPHGRLKQNAALQTRSGKQFLHAAESRGQNGGLVQDGVAFGNKRAAKGDGIHRRVCREPAEVGGDFLLVRREKRRDVDPAW